MIRRCAVLALLIFGLLQPLSAGEKHTLSGRVEAESPAKGEIFVQLYQVATTPKGKILSLTKRDIYGARKPLRTVRLQHAGDFSFENLPPGYYALVAFQDEDGNGKLSFDPPENFGWFAAFNGERFSTIDLRRGDKTGANILLRKPTPFGKTERRTDHGALKWIHGLPVLQLWGTAEERGFAHGYLVGRQIIDFFEFYVLEDSWRSPERYSKIFVPFLENNFNYPEEFLRECRAVLRGMRASGTDMRVRLLGRDFGLTDLLAINAYIERRAAFPGPEPSSCSQFAFWGKMTQQSPLHGGLVAARNMDGECDVRKVTVSHFLLFAVTPSEPGRKRWVSAMWPGFVGTISGINEDGLYAMENAGGTGPGPVPTDVVPCSWIMRYVLEHAGANASPESVLGMMKPFACSEGGITAAGSIIFWAVPYRGQKAPAFVFEGGRSGYAMRLPGQVRPKNPNVLMATNHHKIFGYDPDRPDYSLGVPVYFSSLWRYEAGMQALEAWTRLGRTLTVKDARRLLQTVAHGTTEYAVIFSANEGKIFVSVDDLKPDLWDAPYLQWKEFSFEELFR